MMECKLVTGMPLISHLIFPLYWFFFGLALVNCTLPGLSRIHLDGFSTGPQANKKIKSNE